MLQVSEIAENCFKITEIDFHKTRLTSFVSLWLQNRKVKLLNRIKLPVNSYIVPRQEKMSTRQLTRASD